MQRRTRQRIFLRIATQAWFAVLIVGLLGVAHARPAEPQHQPNTIDVALSSDLNTIAADLKTIADVLRRRDATNEELQKQYEKVGPIATRLQSELGRLDTWRTAIKARLDQLGPPPAAKAPPESADITKERARLQGEYGSIDALFKRTKLLLVQTQQFSTWIAARQHAKFAHSLLERSRSLVDPDLWRVAIEMTPHNVQSARAAIGDWFGAVNARLAGWTAPAFWTAILLVLLAYWPASMFVLHRFARESDAARPGRLRKIIVAWWVAAIIFGCALLAVLAVAGIFRAAGLLVGSDQAVFLVLANAVAYVAAAAGLATGLLAPAHSNWRSVRLGNDRCRETRRVMIIVASLLAVCHVLVALDQAIDADPLYVTTLRGFVAVVVAAVIIAALWRAGASSNAEDIYGPRVTNTRDWYGVLRALLWIVAVAIIVAAALGFLQLAAFLAEQIYWVGLVGFVASMLYILAVEGIDGSCRPNKPFGRAMAMSIGLRSESIEQIAILLSGATTATIFVCAVMAVLAPWGVQSSDLPTYLHAALFGFSVGDITISLASLGVAIAILGAGVAATRAVERWLELRYLPHTRLDIGLRNAIKTSFSYVGFIIALAFASAYLGFNFEKLAIVAGALSVGIGFGLQSVVNNFVSGLILLWERAIRVGDWIVVGSDEGLVRRINVRSTEIETFDRAAVTVPNANLVAGVVKNYVRTDRTGRLQISVPVNAAANPEKAREVLLDIARNHKSVLKDPGPFVNFTNITMSAFNFDLFCFVADVSALGSVKSDLNFEVYRRFKAEGLFSAPPPESVVTLAGLDKLAPLFSKIAAPPRSETLDNGGETG